MAERLAAAAQAGAPLDVHLALVTKYTRYLLPMMDGVCCLEEFLVEESLEVWGRWRHLTRCRGAVSLRSGRQTRACFTFGASGHSPGFGMSGDEGVGP